VFQGIRRALGSAPDQKNAAITAEVRAKLETLVPARRPPWQRQTAAIDGPVGCFDRQALRAERRARP
jgi:hypothetical protein